MKIFNALSKFIAKRSTVDLLYAKLAEMQTISKVSTGSKSEYFQDLWVLACSKQKRNGFFVEFGATDGLSGSNTWLLENSYGWNGILVEPARGYKEDLIRNRSCKLDFRVVWSETGELIRFSEKKEGYLSSVSSTFQKVAIQDEYDVETVKLHDLLVEHGAPTDIDYISIDVEGSELEILNEFFKNCQFNVSLFSVEHNWRKEKRELIDLMDKHGYKYNYENLSYRDLYFYKVKK